VTERRVTGRFNARKLFSLNRYVAGHYRSKTAKYQEVITRDTLPCSHECHTLPCRDQMEMSRSKKKNSIQANKVGGVAHIASYGNHAINNANHEQKCHYK
jgi:hypothetical protein